MQPRSKYYWIQVFLYPHKLTPLYVRPSGIKKASGLPAITPAKTAFFFLPPTVPRPPSLPNHHLPSVSSRTVGRLVSRPLLDKKENVNS